VQWVKAILHWSCLYQSRTFQTLPLWELHPVLPKAAFSSSYKTAVLKLRYASKIRYSLPRYPHFCAIGLQWNLRINFIVSGLPEQFVFFVKIFIILYDLTFSQRRLWWIPSSWMLRRMALVRTDVSVESITSIIRVTGIDRLDTTLAVTSNSRTLRMHFLPAFFGC
jgi:hypothetical protein